MKLTTVKRIDRNTLQAWAAPRNLPGQHEDSIHMMANEILDLQEEKRILGINIDTLDSALRDARAQLAAVTKERDAALMNGRLVRHLYSNDDVISKIEQALANLGIDCPACHEVAFTGNHMGKHTCALAALKEGAR